MLAAASNQMAAVLERHQALALPRERLQRELDLSRQIYIALPDGRLALLVGDVSGSA